MFGRLGPVEIILILALVLLFFGGRGKISAMMGDMAKGIKSFRKGMKDPEDADNAQPATMIGEPINVTPEKEKSKA
ncbi:MAG: twin-arginine translocase TatA/TatE family subunit [Alphaproteobacteria bacterium]|nr:twin-arginine translocase TatA/TatE family subunit [Alphaproteobacteria bacterium]